MAVNRRYNFKYKQHGDSYCKVLIVVISGKAECFWSLHKICWSTAQCADGVVFHSKQRGQFVLQYLAK